MEKIPNEADTKGAGEGKRVCVELNEGGEGGSCPPPEGRPERWDSGAPGLGPTSPCSVETLCQVVGGLGEGLGVWRSHSLGSPICWS